ncbi:MAG: DUF2505 domain-containing protein [Sandaracinaceae bacterium]|nr:DUF2505 domain-containing protein [Sandaracinaceae bacterium]MCC6875429.1 DUF2505 domain-containing protein [Sandaracinaceae bacterium]
MKFTIKNVFDTDVDSYWNKCFFDREYNERLYSREGLDFHSFAILEQTGGPGENRTRVLRTEPKSDAPAVVKKLIGDSLAYTEKGSWDAKTKTWSYQITTSKLADKIHIGGKFWVEPRGPKQCERISEVEIEVKIFGVGGTIEKFVEKTTRESYQKTYQFTQKYIQEKGL